MPNTATDTPLLSHGIVLEQGAGRAVVALPESDYQLHLRIDKPLECSRQGEVIGRVRVQALKVDGVGAGGLFIEPVYGRPRRVQGRVVAKDSAANILTVQGPCVVVAELDVTQRAGEFPLGGLVGFNVRDGSRWVCE